MTALLLIKAAQVVLSIVGGFLLAAVAAAFGRSQERREGIPCMVLLASCIAINIWAVLT